MSGIIGPRYLIEYREILEVASSLGYSLPSNTQQNKQNSLIYNLKTSGIWDQLDILYIFATDGGSDFATLNWKDPSSYQCNKVNSPTFTSNVGFNGNGSNSYLDTQWAAGIDGINFQRDDASAFVYCGTNAAQNSRQIFGSSTGSFPPPNNAIRLNPRNSAAGQARFSINDDADAGPNVSSAIGFYHLQRTASDLRKQFKDGIENYTNSTFTSQPLNDNAIYIGAVNSNGGTTQYRDAITSIFGVGNSLNGLELNLYTYWNNYFTSL